MSNSKNVANASARKLIVHQSGQFWATSPGVDVLSALPTKAPLSLVAIIGTSRGGKSTLLNCLAGDQIFKVSNSWGKPCTAGVDISSYTMLREYLLNGCDNKTPDSTSSNSMKLSPVLQCPEEPGSPSIPLSIGVASASSTPPRSLRESYVGFVDVEGQGDRDNLFDVNLALPILISSAVVIFNWHGPLQRNTLLDGLGTLAKAGRCFDSESEGGSLTQTSSSTRGTHLTPMFSPALTKTSSDSKQRRSTLSRWSNVEQKPSAPFGHLKIVARDSNNYDDDPKHMKEAWDRLMEEEYEDDTEPDSSEQQEIRTRNSIRRTLQESFKSITFHPLPRIVDNLDLHKRNPTGIPQSLISTGFQESVVRLRTDIYNNTALPFLYKSLILTGPRMRTLIEKVVDFVNQGNFSVGGLWQSMQADMIQRYRDAALQMFSDTLEKMRNELPFYSTEALQMRLENAKDSAIDEFDNLCESLDTSAHEKADDVVGRMTMDMAKECDLLRRENQTILQEHTLYMRDVVERLTPHIIEKLRDETYWPLEFSTVTEWINKATHSALDDFRSFLISNSTGHSEVNNISIPTIKKEAQVEFETFVADRLTKTAATEFARMSSEMSTRRSLEDKIVSLEKYKGVMGVLNEQKKKVERMHRISKALSGRTTQGYLLKRGQRSALPVWNRRYCVLTINSIKYFKLSRAVAAAERKSKVQGVSFSLPTNLRPRRVVDLTPDTQIVVHCDLEDSDDASVKVTGELFPPYDTELKVIDGDVDFKRKPSNSHNGTHSGQAKEYKDIVTKSALHKEKNLFRTDGKRKTFWPFSFASGSSCSSVQEFFTFSIRVPLTPFKPPINNADANEAESNIDRTESPPTDVETRDFTFRTKSREDCLMWVNALRETIDFLRFGERGTS